MGTQLFVYWLRGRDELKSRCQPGRRGATIRIHGADHFGSRERRADPAQKRRTREDRGKEETRRRTERDDVRKGGKRKRVGGRKEE